MWPRSPSPWIPKVEISNRHCRRKRQFLICWRCFVNLDADVPFRKRSVNRGSKSLTGISGMDWRDELTWFTSRVRLLYQRSVGSDEYAWGNRRVRADGKELQGGKPRWKWRVINVSYGTSLRIHVLWLERSSARLANGRMYRTSDSLSIYRIYALPRIQYFRLQPVCLNIVQHSRYLDRVAGFNSTKMNFRRSGSVFNKSSFDENARCASKLCIEVSAHPHVVQAPN